MKRKEIDFSTLLDRAKKQKLPFEQAAEVSRRVYAGEMGGQLMLGEAVSTWNFLRIATQNTLARIVAADPVAQIRSKSAEHAAVGEVFQENAEAKLAESSITPALRSAVQDAILFGNGFLYVNSDATVEALNYFDVYIDNAMATTTNINDGRYLFIRRLVDTADAMERFPKYKNKTKVPGDGDNNFSPSEVPGRDVVGATVLDYTRSESEKTTRAISDFNLLASVGDDSNLDMEGDGLTEVFELFVTDSESPSGWKQQFYIDEELVDETDLPEYMDGPPIVAINNDNTSGQFYQPSMYIHVQYNQAAANQVNAKILRNISMIDMPPMITTPGSGIKGKGYMLSPGEVMECASKSDAPEFMKLPTVPDQYFKIIEVLKDEVREETGIHEVADGGNSKGVTSGVALQTLAQQTNIRVGLLMDSVEEGLKDLARIMVLVMFDNLRNEDDMISMIDPQLIKKDFIFDFVITPQTNREQKIDQLITAVTAMTPLAGDNPILALKLAAAATQNEEMAKSFIKILEEAQAQAQPMQPEQLQQTEQPMSEAAQIYQEMNAPKGMQDSQVDVLNDMYNK